MWRSGFFHLINKIPFNVVLNIKKGGSVVEDTEIGSCKVGGVGKVVVLLWFCSSSVCDSTNMTLSGMRVTSLDARRVHIRRLSNVTLKHS